MVDNQKDKVFMIKNGTLVVNNDAILSSNLIEESVALAKPEGSVTLEYSEEEIIFTIESWGQLSCKEVLLEGLNQLNMQCDDFAKLVK